MEAGEDSSGDVVNVVNVFLCPKQRDDRVHLCREYREERKRFTTFITFTVTGVSYGFRVGRSTKGP